ncbi:MAG: UDP-2,3-diacylglucosamine diphosphatase [Tepidimonas sp.]
MLRSDSVAGRTARWPDAAVGTRPSGVAVTREGGRFEPDEDDHPAEGRERLRAVFISDLHLGTPGCQAKALLAFLKAHPSDRLYLVGDIIDGWQLRRRWYWPQSHNDVVQKILRRARKGCQVVFIPGNHDEFVREFVGHPFGGVDVVEEAVHETADGRRLWVTHGDLYDGVIQYAKWLAYLGDTLYEWALRLNRHVNSWRARMGLPYWSLSQYLKHRVKSAVSFITRFEEALAHEARRRGLDGVVCGHIHRPEMRVIDGVLYCNDGDWVESLSALVEHADGRLEIVHWAQERVAVPVTAGAVVRRARA